MDEETFEGKNFEWPRILVKTKGRRVPESLQVVVGQLCFAIKLWWELPPWVSQVFPRAESWGGLKKKRGNSSALESVGKLVPQQDEEDGKKVYSGKWRSVGKKDSASFSIEG